MTEKPRRGRVTVFIKDEAKAQLYELSEVLNKPLGRIVEDAIAAEFRRHEGEGK